MRKDGRKVAGARRETACHVRSVAAARLDDERPLGARHRPDALDRRDFLERRLAEAGASSVVPGSGVDLDRFQPRPESAGPPALLPLRRRRRWAP